MSDPLGKSMGMLNTSRLQVVSSLERSRRALLEAAKDFVSADDEAGRMVAEALRQAEAELQRAKAALGHP